MQLIKYYYLEVCKLRVKHLLIILKSDFRCHLRFIFQLHSLGSQPATKEKKQAHNEHTARFIFGSIASQDLKLRIDTLPFTTFEQEFKQTRISYLCLRGNGNIASRHTIIYSKDKSPVPRHKKHCWARQLAPTSSSRIT